MNDNLLQSQIVLLKNALAFYSDENSYKTDSIQKDAGHIARHSLNLVKNIDDQINASEVDYEKSYKKIEEKLISEIYSESEKEKYDSAIIKILQIGDIIDKKINNEE